MGRGKAKSDKIVAVDDDDGAPEEISAQSADIQRLRELHEAMVAPRKRSKRERPQRRTVADRVDGNVALDASVLEGLEDEDLVGNQQDKEEEDEEEDEEEISSKRIRLKIDKTARNSKKIGHITVTTLSSKDDAVSSFIGSHKTGVKSVVQLVGSTVPRVRTANFAAQKRGEPSKQFAKSKSRSEHQK
jgi:hypothetical protein